MDICAYYDYKVIWCQSGGYIDEENSEKNDIVFKDYESDDTFIINGGKLLEKISKLLCDEKICGFSVIKNTIRIEHFNATNGESDDYIITIQELKEEDNKNE